VARSGLRVDAVLRDHGGWRWTACGNRALWPGEMPGLRPYLRFELTLGFESSGV
jgi:hypothetical protein